MKTKSVNQLDAPRVFIHDTPTVSSLFLVRLRMSAELNVLKALGINSSYLHDMGAKELKTLLESLHDATTRATQESGRRSG